MSNIEIISLLVLLLGIPGGYAIMLWGIKRLREAEDHENHKHS